MKINKKEFSKMAGDASPGSPIWKDFFFAFVFGGAICTHASISYIGFAGAALGFAGLVYWMVRLGNRV